MPAKGFVQNIKLIEKALKIINKKAYRKILAEEALGIIYKRTKDGKGVSSDEVEDPSNVPLKSLSTSYKLQRQGKIRFITKNGKVIPILPERKKSKKTGKKLKSRNKFTIKFGKFGSATKSNLTYTGQLLDALRYKILKNGFRIYIKASKRKDMNGGKTKLTNAEVAKRVSENGRPFLGLSKKEQKLIIAKFKTLVRKITRKI